MTSEKSLNNGHFGQNNDHFGHTVTFYQRLHTTVTLKITVILVIILFRYFIFPNIFLSFLKTFVCPRPEKFLQTIGAPWIIHKKTTQVKIQKISGF